MKLMIEIESETFNKVFHGGLFEKDNKLIESVTKAFQNVTIIPNEERPTINCKDCDGYEAGYSAGLKDAERPQGEWIDYNNTFYKCPDCGYLLEKCCPECQNKVILPKGGAE